MLLSWQQRASAGLWLRANGSRGCCSLKSLGMKWSLAIHLPLTAAPRRQSLSFCFWGFFSSFIPDWSCLCSHWSRESALWRFSPLSSILFQPSADFGASWRPYGKRGLMSSHPARGQWMPSSTRLRHTRTHQWHLNSFWGFLKLY